MKKSKKNQRRSFLLLIDETANLLPQRLEETKKMPLEADKLLAAGYISLSS
ncbi:hypothetical protein [Desulfosporosinus lacus]|uniref:hypothetical protein n=1 Tax=Desulfosporosinus lacus TaxID=329936 RepID=UPI001A9A415A|nr:hypothetical protein [Desulfosporosinus lacus]